MQCYKFSFNFHHKSIKAACLHLTIKQILTSSLQQVLKPIFRPWVKRCQRAQNTADECDKLL